MIIFNTLRGNHPSLNRYCSITPLVFLLIISSGTFAQQPKLMLPIGHTLNLFSAEFSPDGKKVVTASMDNTAKIWDAGRIILLADLKGHTSVVLSAKFSPDGNKIVTASMDSTAKIWDVATGKLLADLKGSKGIIDEAEFSPDGKRILTASRDAIAKIWDAESGALLIDLKGHSAETMFARFSPDGKKIVTGTFKDNIAKIWDAVTGKLLADLEGHKNIIFSARFSPDSKKIVTASNDKNAKIWEVATGKLLTDLQGHKEAVFSARFSPEGNYIVTASVDNTAKVWTADSGKLLVDLKESAFVTSAKFSPDGKKIVTIVDEDSTAKIWDVLSGKLLATLTGHGDVINSIGFSPDGKKIITAADDFTAKIWDPVSGRLLSTLAGHSFAVVRARFSPDGKKIVLVSNDNMARLCDVGTGKLLTTLKGHYGDLTSAEFSPDGKKIVTSSDDSTCIIWDAVTGNFLTILKGHGGGVSYSVFNPDGKKIVTASDDKMARIWDAGTGRLLITLKGHSAEIESVQFSPDGKKIVTAADDKMAKIWDAGTGKLLITLKGHTENVYSAQFSPDGKKILTTSIDGTVRIWDAISGKFLNALKKQAHVIFSAEFSPDATKIITAGSDNTAKVWDAVSGVLLTDLKGHNQWASSAQFSRDGTKIVTGSIDNTCKIWNALTGEMLYTFIGIDDADYLVLNKDNQYDGTEAARKLLYFTCGTEIIELDQVKDQLWVPNLAERIMKGDSINAKTLEQLNICGLTPQVEDHSSNSDAFRFKILSRRGGLGETVLYVNGIEAKRYRKDQLQKTSEGYELLIKKSDLDSFFVTGSANPVMVKAYTSDNAISSRGFTIEADKTGKTIPPNLYAVIIGVSDYKGDDLDLQYADKDATDISNALAITSRRLLNNDGKEHVFIYNLTTDTNRYLLPEKNSIKKTFLEIGTKATANDILFIFFAGHGVMQGDADNKQFYFLTADASKASASKAADVGISTAELSEWMQPATIKAQKRILIFDACNSGQAIRDFVQLGKPGQGYVAARNDDKGQQIKAIEKLNDQSGLFILAASATNQSAYEMGRYSQGLLTYSLLKAIKQQPDILESGKYLDVSNWLNAAKKTATILAGESGARQDPQLNANNNFNIGLVDEEVRNKIVLSDAKPVFSRSNFQNVDTKTDNLKIRSSIDKKLFNISSGSFAPINYSADYEGADAYSLTGDYKITGENVIITVLITKGGTEVHRYEIKGHTADNENITSVITTAAMDWLKKH